MLSPWIIRTLTLPPLLASLVPRNFCRYHTPTIYVPQNSHHTYLLWHFHSHSEIYCHATFHRSVHHLHDILYFCHIAIAWSCSWHRICGKATKHYFSYMSLLIHCTIPVHRRRHSIESYFVLVSSCNSYVVINRSVMIIIVRALPQKKRNAKRKKKRSKKSRK